MRRSRYHRQCLAKGIAAGLVAGLVGSWAMNKFQSLWTPRQNRENSNTAGQPDTRQAQDDRREVPPDDPIRDDEDATSKLAGKIAQVVFHRELNRDQRRALSPFVHYGFGAFAGAVYGGIAEFFPRASFGAGLPFGSALFIAADELGVPAMGLSKGPSQYPLSSHLYGLASHLVYGATAELLRRTLRH
jgi:uncharacterized membrane protein YagU involved in acid resistance